MRERFHDRMQERDDNYTHATPQDSYSRELDSRVQESEMPYGYSEGEPSADTGDFHPRQYETKIQQRPRKHG